MSFLKLTQRFTYLASIVFPFLLLIVNTSVAQQKQTDHDKITDKFPATHFDFNIDTGKLQFAIISDVWGGNRPGVFEDAIGKLELLQPQFVMSVGDLIDGQTYDSLLVDKQWNEFNQKVRSLSMPFFYVPGNHDIGNAWMEKEWKRRFGLAYYYFVYKNVLFLCVNTQDGGSSGIDEEQVGYFKKAIAENAQARWTFIFMHRPVWFNKDGKEEGYERIEALLKGHNYTLFSGHFHTYLNVQKNGNKHFVLGSTGGGSDLRGEKFGEFDHITWVTLRPGKQPEIVNLKLNGIIKENVVNENTYPITNTLIDELWLVTPSYVSQNEFEKSISPVIIFNNPTSYPLKIFGNLPNRANYRISPQKIDLTIPPHNKQTQQLTITSNTDSLLNLSTLPFVEVSLQGAYRFDTVTYELPATKRLLLDWKHILPEQAAAGSMADKQFENDDTTGLIAISNPEFLQNKWYWHGTDDCGLRFKLTRDVGYLYLLAIIQDDQLVLGNSGQQDLVYVHFEDKNGVPARFTILPDHIKSVMLPDSKTSLVGKDTRLKTTINGDHLIKLSLRVPLDKIMQAGGSIRFNIGYRDQDNYPDKQNSTLFWKPLWGTETDYINSGTFILK